MILLEDALARFRDLQDRRGIGWVLCYIGCVACHQGNTARADRYFQESLAFFHVYGNKLGLAVCVEGLAGVASHTGHAARATQLLATAETLRETIGTPRSPVEQRDYERQVTLLRAQLGEQQFVAAWSAGCAISMTQILTIFGAASNGD